MLHSHRSPPDVRGSSLGTTTLRALFASAAALLSAGCSLDSPTPAGLDQTNPMDLRAAVHPAASVLRGATQISGVGFYAEPGQCGDPEGQGSDYALFLTGDLAGCVYVYVESARCSAGEAYIETGTETFVGRYNGAPGTFRTTYLFTAKYRDCANLAGQIAGRCQHPIIAGTGDGVFDGVIGRLDMTDDVEEGNFSYRGHFRF